MRNLYAISILLLSMLLAPALRAQCQGGSVPTPCIDDPNSPNEVVGVSEILTPYYYNIDSYSATELGANVAMWYDARVDANLYEGTTLVDWGSAVGISKADLRLGPQYAVQNLTYRVESEHFLQAVECDNPGEGGCYSPYSFTNQYTGTNAWRLWTSIEDRKSVV